MDDRAVVVPGERWPACLPACLPACSLPGEQLCQSVLRCWPSGRPSDSDQSTGAKKIYTLLFLSFSSSHLPVLLPLLLSVLSIVLCPRPTCPRLPGTVALASRCSDWGTGRSSSTPPSRRRSPLTSRIQSRVSAGQFLLVLLRRDDERYQRSLYTYIPTTMYMSV